MAYLDRSRLGPFIERYFSDIDTEGPYLTEPGRACGYYDTVRFFGENAVDPVAIRIEYNEEQFAFADDRIGGFASEMAARMREEGRLTKGPEVMKLCSFDVEKRRMQVQPVAFDDVAGSCFALDYRHPLFDGFGGNLREYYKSRHPSLSIEDNPLAISLGVCALVLVNDGGIRYLLKVRRAGHVATLPGECGPSVAGNVDFATGYSSLQELLIVQLGRELIEELGLSMGECRITSLAYSREIFRGERPQLFALVECNLSRAQLAARLESLPTPRREFDSYEFVVFGLSAEGLNHEAAMNHALIEEYLSLR